MELLVLIRIMNAAPVERQADVGKPVRSEDLKYGRAIAAPVRQSPAAQFPA
jgi:hypothetical protein